MYFIEPVFSKTFGRSGVTFRIYCILCLASASLSSLLAAFPKYKCGSISTGKSLSSSGPGRKIIKSINYHRMTKFTIINFPINLSIGKSHQSHPLRRLNISIDYFKAINNELLIGLTQILISKLKESLTNGVAGTVAIRV